MSKRLLLLVCALFFAASAFAEQPVKVAVTSILSGDLGVLGQNIVLTAETYRKHYLRHPLEFVYEDARLSSVDGLRAYQKVIHVDKADMIIGGCSSNGTMAAKELINSTKTPTVTVVTGGHNIDHAGKYIFRIGNSDTINGLQEADYFIKHGQLNAALLTEDTEYTQDISKAFLTRFKELGGKLVYEQTFLPGASDFRSEISLMKKSAPQAIFMPTQTGLALGVFLKQWSEQGGNRSIPVHTTFVAAHNTDAKAAAGELIYGTYYMAPEYDAGNPDLKRFFDLYRQDHGKDPAIAFHTAGTVDTLNMLQNYLDGAKQFDRDAFVEYLLANVKNYKGLMGTYSFDAEGNADLGFTMSQITKEAQ